MPPIKLKAKVGDSRYSNVPNVKRVETNLQLAKYLSAACEGDYSVHEFQDMLNILCPTVLKLMQKDYQITLAGLCVFYPNIAKPRLIKSKVARKGYIDVPERKLPYVKLTDNARERFLNKIPPTNSNSWYSYIFYNKDIDSLLESVILDCKDQLEIEGEDYAE
jgi:hypothetical protein